jgi:hypothetical protein
MITERYEKLLWEFYQELSAVGMSVQYLDRSEELALPSLLVQAPPDDEDRERWVSLAFVPDDGEFEELDLMQLYMDLPVSLDRADIAPRLPAVNEASILGHAGVRAAGEVYLRLVWPIPRGMPIISSVLIELLQLFVFSAELATRALNNNT